jgi:hypothetical protein
MFHGYGVERDSMESLVSLQYPNGRIHEASLTLPNGLRPGDRFELHGRHWQAVKSKPTRRYSMEVPRVLCVSTEPRAGAQVTVSLSADTVPTR